MDEMKKYFLPATNISETTYQHNPEVSTTYGPQSEGNSAMNPFLEMIFVLLRPDVFIRYGRLVNKYQKMESEK